MEKQNNPRKLDVLWSVAKNSWRLASSLGTAVFILLAVIMHVYSWWFDQPELVTKALEGVQWAVMYGVACVIWKVIKIWDESGKKKR